MRTINVDYNMLLQSASYIEELNNEYKRLYTQLNTDVDTLSSTWNGKDNIAFTNQIKGFNDDFNQMNLLLTQYVTFLKNSAESYRQTQEELVNHVQRLAN